MNFNSLAEKTIIQISDSIERYDEHGAIEVEYEEGILTIDTSRGQYVLNKNLHLQELWLSSPITGGYHFKHNIQSQQWLDKHNYNLLTLLHDEIHSICGIKVIWH